MEKISGNHRREQDDLWKKDRAWLRPNENKAKQKYKNTKKKKKSPKKRGNQNQVPDVMKCNNNPELEFPSWLSG